jgi:hypothetical protein
MTIVSGLLGVRPKRAPPGMHRSIGRFGSYTGLSRFACPKSRDTVFSSSGISGRARCTRTGLLGTWHCHHTFTSQSLKSPS